VVLRTYFPKESRKNSAPGYIGIGGNMVLVPAGYLTLESEYTKNEMDLFDTAFYEGTNQELEEARIAVLDKRVEFYDRYSNSLL
jgi:hypothetical protein|tara:strand:+ start:17639 stop:17890 length:252 start_codon:yes stop_codon:yes gene_type:complete